MLLLSLYCGAFESYGHGLTRAGECMNCCTAAVLIRTELGLDQSAVYTRLKKLRDGYVTVQVSSLALTTEILYFEENKQTAEL